MCRYLPPLQAHPNGPQNGKKRSIVPVLLQGGGHICPFHPRGGVSYFHLLFGFLIHVWEHPVPLFAAAVRAPKWPSKWKNAYRPYFVPERGHVCPCHTRGGYSIMYSSLVWLTHACVGAPCAVIFRRCRHPNGPQIGRKGISSPFYPRGGAKISIP